MKYEIKIGRKPIIVDDLVIPQELLEYAKSNYPMIQLEGYTTEMSYVIDRSHNGKEIELYLQEYDPNVGYDEPSTTWELLESFPIIRQYNEWQNTGMVDQPIFEYELEVGSYESRLSDAKDGKVIVYTYDRKWQFEVRFAENYHAIFIRQDPSGKKHVMDLAYSASSLPFYGYVEKDCGSKVMIDTSKMDEEEAYLANCKDLWLEVVGKFNDVYRFSYTYIWVDEAKLCLEKLCNACGVNFHFEEWEDYETHEQGWFVCNDELWHQLGHDVGEGKGFYICFSEDAIDTVCKEVNGTCDRVWQKVAMRDPDGYIFFDMGYRVVGDACRR